MNLHDLDAVVPARRCRVIIDNDFAGDPDGLVQLAHHFLSPSVDIRLVIGSHLKENDPLDPSCATADHAAELAGELAGITGREDVRIIAGSNIPMPATDMPASSEAADAIISEALREDTELPLFVVCGGGLTEIASAWVKEPAVADRLTLIWIGGEEHEGLASPPPNGTAVEYNHNIDLAAAEVVFNISNLMIWQVPRNMYRTPIVSQAEIASRIKPCGRLGEFLYRVLAEGFGKFRDLGRNLGETYILGDSPLVLLTALTTPFQPDAASSSYITKPCPYIRETGAYTDNPDGRPLRIYTSLDNRLLLEDFFTKLTLFASMDSCNTNLSFLQNG